MDIFGLLTGPPPKVAFSSFSQPLTTRISLVRLRNEIACARLDNFMDLILKAEVEESVSLI